MRVFSNVGDAVKIYFASSFRPASLFTKLCSYSLQCIAATGRGQAIL